jgi:formate dehydrogenase major subunit
VQRVDSDVLEMHPDDVARLQLRPGRHVRLVSARGTAVLPLMASERVRPGELFTSFHFPVTDVNSLLSSSADESSKCPEYKVSTVRVEAAETHESVQEGAALRPVHSRIRARP